MIRALVAIAVAALSSPVFADPLDRWAGPIAEASTRFGVPEDWIRRVMQAESGGQSLLAGRPIVSIAGAMGLMQLMPKTWRDVRALLGLGADPFDPRDNILAGTFYLRFLYDRFGYPGLFAAYNAGPARYAALLAGGGPLPHETRAYVATLAGLQRPARRAPAIRPVLTLFAIRSPSGSVAAAGLQPRSPANSLFVRVTGN